MLKNRNYIFHWKKYLFWKKRKVIGHHYEKDADKMVLYDLDGGIREISQWSKCECHLGVDWVLATEESIKEESGK